MPSSSEKEPSLDMTNSSDSPDVPNGIITEDDENDLPF